MKTNLVLGRPKRRMKDTGVIVGLFVASELLEWLLIAVNRFKDLSCVNMIDT
jgi:hypothetical protein